MTPRWLQGLLIAALVVGSMVIGGVITAAVVDDGGEAFVATPLPPTPAAAERPVASSPAATPSIDSSALAALPRLPDLVEDVRRSVVEIVARQLDRRGNLTGRSSLGTGFVIDLEGHVLTNFHVIEGADVFQIELWDGTKAVANVIGTDPANDLAVLRISVQPQRLHPVSFADSDLARVGEPVFAIGNPFGQQFSVTTGVISGVGRTSDSSFTNRRIRDVLQTDAALNPGNSGGPLFNAAGQVLGINTSITTPDVGTNEPFFVGLGFAVPSNTALRFLPDMIAGKTVQHAQLGIRGAELDELTALDAGVDIHQGIYVTAVAGGSAAGNAGLREARFNDGGELDAGGDVILAIDGVPTNDFDTLASIIDGHEVGDEVTLTVYRSGNTIEIEVTLQEWRG